MSYTDAEARSLIIKAGITLVKEKLIARTWGNISARISDKEFIITPSGRAYDTLRPEDLVVVNIKDCSYKGNIKPSSEKGIHADSYTARKDVDFIIHTHQLYASAVSVAGKDTPSAVCCGYGLPGTKKLRRAVLTKVKAHPDKKSFLLSRHGALFLGSDYDDAFRAAFDTEAECRKIFEDGKREVPLKRKQKPFLDDYAQIMGNHGKPTDEDEETMKLIKEKNYAAAEYAGSAHPMGRFDVFLQHFIYKRKYSKLKNVAPANSLQT